MKYHSCVDLCLIVGLMVRVANTGISAVIQPDGDITARTDLFTRGTEIRTVHWRHGGTIYTMVGDLFSEICFGLSAIGLVLAVFIAHPPQADALYGSGLLSANGSR